MLKVQEIREIINLVDQSSINEFTYETNGTVISMKKATAASEVPFTQKAVETAAPQQVQVPPVSEQATMPETAEKPKETKEEEVSNTKLDYDVEIVSPMVGTFYRKPSPESDPYVKLNSKVEESTIVCIVEAMKLFNEIEAETSGEIVEILVEDGELVEYGQPLFRVKKD